MTSKYIWVGGARHCTLHSLVLCIKWAVAIYMRLCVYSLHAIYLTVCLNSDPICSLVNNLGKASKQRWNSLYPQCKDCELAPPLSWQVNFTHMSWHLRREHQLDLYCGFSKHQSTPSIIHRHGLRKLFEAYREQGK